MILCSCSGLSDKDVIKATDNGVVDIESLREMLGVGSNCGRCVGHLLLVLNRERQRMGLEPIEVKKSA